MADVAPEMLDTLQREAFSYFVHEANPRNGLVADKTQRGSPASIAAVGLALSCYPVGVERGFMTRADAIVRVLSTLRFFHGSVQGIDADATGYKGFYYHFLDMEEGRRVWQCELSTVDTAFLLAGMLTAAAYFSGDTAAEREIRERADALYLRVDWTWARNDGLTVTQGWKPESGFLPFCWEGYNEALFLYLLGLGSPTFPLSAESYTAWASTYEWRTVYGYSYLHSGPMFTHQISHLWVDFRSIQDEYMRGKGIDYFENSRRATLIQQQYAVANPGQYAAYGAECWGITASDGPGPAECIIDGRKRRFFDYLARGVPDGPDDGSIAPWAAVASLPFAPEVVARTLQYFETLKLRTDPYGFKATFNHTVKAGSATVPCWVSPFHLGLNQGPIVLMIENHRTGMLWRLMKGCPYWIAGLRRAGFTGAWLDTPPNSQRLGSS